jgi:hypothetical protein
MADSSFAPLALQQMAKWGKANEAAGCRKEENQKTKGKRQKSKGRSREEIRSPTDNALFSLVQLSIIDAAVADTYDFAHALGLRAKRLVTQEATDICGSLIVQHIKPDQTITGVAQLRAIKPMIAREEGRTAQCMKQREDVIAIFHARAPDLHADLPEMNLPRSQLVTLTQQNVLVKNIHAARRRLSVSPCCSLSIFSASAVAASSTASAMASRLTLPKHSVVIQSQSLPCAT